MSAPQKFLDKNGVISPSPIGVPDDSDRLSEQDVVLWLKSKDIDVTPTMVHKYSLMTDTNEIRALHNELLEHLKLRVAGVFTADTDDERNIHVEMADSQMVIWSSKARKRCYTCMEVIRGRTKAGKTVEAADDHYYRDNPEKMAGMPIK